MLSGTGYPTGKKILAGAGTGKILYPHAGMCFYRVELELAGAGMKQHYPTGFYPLPSLNGAKLVGECPRSRSDFY
jgi:hypothetical protein